jgi:hypothetical protein
MNNVKPILAVPGVALAVFPLAFLTCLPVEAQDCDVTGGDQMYTFVDTKVHDLSRQLAMSDYNNRGLGLPLNALQDLNTAIAALNDRLNAIRAQSDQASAGSGDVPYALALSASSQSLIEELLSIRHDLDVALSELQSVVSVPSADPPSLAEFKQTGLEYVGRQTFLESFQSLGNTAEASLNERYYFYASVTIDSAGNITGDPNPLQFGGVVDIFGGIAIESGNPYAIATYVALKIGTIIYGIEDCSKKVEQQRERLGEALRLLPSRLPSTEELFSFYVQARNAQIGAFSKYTSDLQQELDLLDARWRSLLSYNVLREKTAQTVLTDDKIKKIRADIESDSAVQRLFNGLVIGRLLGEEETFNGYIAQKHIAVVTACGDVDGYLAADDALDAIRYGQAAYSVYKKQPSLIPLFDSLDGELKAMDDDTKDVVRLRLNLRNRKCAPGQGPGSSSVAASRRIGPSRLRLLSARRQILATASNPLVPTDPPFGFCALYIQSPDQVYSCQTPAGASGTPYSSLFDHSTGDPVQDILLGAHDGGYKEDNRRVSSAIDECEKNIGDRIADLNQKNKEAQAAVPEWVEKNEIAINKLIKSTKDAGVTDGQSMDLFSTQNAEAVASAKQEVDDFLKLPSDPARTSQFLASVNVGEAALPAIPAVAVPTDAPPLSGITAFGLSYGSEDALSRSFEQETRRIERDIPNGSPDSVYSHAVLTLAARFAASHTGTGDQIAQDLLKDAASARYFYTQTTPTLTVTTLDASQGAFSRVDVTPLDSGLPVTAVIKDASQFDNSVSVARSQLGAAAVVADALTGTDLERAKEFLGWGSSLLDQANELYFAGQPAEAEVLVTAANQIGEAVQGNVLVPVLDEALDFSKELFGSTLSASEDNAIGELGRVATDIEGLDTVVGLTKDFLGFNSSLVQYLNQPSGAKAQVVAEFAIKFGLSLTASAFLAAVATYAALPTAAVVAAGIAGTVAADYATRALIYASAHQAPRPSPRR